MTDYSAPKYDWQAIRLDYETGVLTLSEISKRHGPSPSRIADEARNKGWVRNRPPSNLEKMAHLAAADTKPYDLDSLTENAVITAKQVVVAHRTDAARIRALSNTIVERLALHLNGQEVERPFIGARESPADLLEKLSRVQVRMTELERQAYGLATFDPDSVAKEEEVNETVKELWDMVHEMQSDKAAKR
jgi:hypothetical protein